MTITPQADGSTLLTKKPKLKSKTLGGGSAAGSSLDRQGVARPGFGYDPTDRTQVKNALAFSKAMSWVPGFMLMGNIAAIIEQARLDAINEEQSKAADAVRDAMVVGTPAANTNTNSKTNAKAAAAQAAAQAGAVGPGQGIDRDPRSGGGGEVGGGLGGGGGNFGGSRGNRGVKGVH
jgi:hypothetical protein